MIELLITNAENEQVSLPLGNTEISINAENPMFDTDSRQRTYTFPFNLPMSPQVATAFRFPYRLDRKATNIFPAQFKVNSLYFAEGNLKIEGIKQNALDADFRVKDTQIIEFLKKTKIRDFLNTVNTGRRGNNANEPNDFKGVGSDVVQRYYHTWIESQLRAGDNSAFDFPAFNHYRRYGFRTTLDPYNPQSRNLKWQSIVNPIRYNPTNDVMSFVMNTDNDEDDNYTKAQAWEATYSPMVKFRWLLKKIVEKTQERYSVETPDVIFLQDVERLKGFDFEVPSDEKSDFMSLLFYNEFIFDDIVKSRFTHNRDFYCNVFKAEFDSRELVPDWTAYEFIQKICEQFALRFDIKHQILTFKKKKDTLDTEIQDLTAKAQRNTIVNYSDASGMGYVLRFQEEDYYIEPYSNRDSPMHFPTKIVGNGFTQRVLPFSSLPLSFEGIYGFTVKDFRVTALLDRQDPSKTFESRENAPENLLRAVYCKGWRQGLNSNQQVRVAESRGQVIHLTIQSLYEQLFEGVIELQSSGFELQDDFDLSPTDILDLRDFKNAYWQIQYPFGTAKGIVKKFNVKIKQNGVSLTNVTLFCFI